jgi:UDP-N-acetylglucosamine 3-dehydrogenase
MNDSTIGFGIIGLGGISRAHVQGLVEATDAARIVAVCDTNESLARSVAEQVGAVAYTDYRQLLAHPGVQAVDGPLPHNLHYRIAKEALEAGKHMLLEKPMAPTSKECAELIAIAKSRGLTFGVAENTPFVSSYVAVRKLIESGAIGTPRLIRTLISGSEVERLNDVTNWKGRTAGTVGGAIFDAGPHSFYLLKWLFGDIARVQAIANKVVEVSEVEDNGVVAGQMASGALFTTEYSFTAEIPWGERLEIYGSIGSIIVDQLLDPVAVHYRHNTDMSGVPVPGAESDTLGWKFKSIAAGVGAFARAAAQGKPAPVSAEDGMYVIKVVEAAYKSVDGGGVAVTV